jgi:hypothetical protein
MSFTKHRKLPDFGLRIVKDTAEAQRTQRKYKYLKWKNSNQEAFTEDCKLLTVN